MTISGPAANQYIRDTWVAAITNAANDHETRLAVLETGSLVIAKLFSGTVQSSSSTETPITAWTTNNATNALFKAGYAYKVECTTRHYNDGASGVGDNTFFLRKTVNNTSSQLLGSERLNAPSGNSSIVTSTINFYVHNATGADISASLGIGVNKMVGGGNAKMTDTRIAMYVIGTVAGIGATNLSAMSSTAIA